MSKQITLGSLFDGIGGFPLSGAMCGVEPVWASEIEPFPIAVTMNRFPNMKHLASVTDIKGDQIEPVDIITFGSPCQDLSVAGKQAGIHEGARSNLFFEAVRIIKEMREHDRSTGRTGFDVRPRFAVWENVPGAFSSGKGKDFQAVLQTLCEVSDPYVSIPLVEGGWSKSGCIVGNGYSVAWRVYDAQYWGVPQRRKRIYLVADFASKRAGEILFESEGVSGHPETSRETRQGTTEDAEGGVGGSGFFEPRSLMEENWSKQNIKNALRAEASKSSHVVVCSFMGGQGAKAMGIGYNEIVSPTIKSVMSGGNTIPDVVYPNVERTLTSEADESFCIDRDQNVVCIEGNGQRESHLGNGYAESDQMYTLNTVEKHAVCYGIGSYASNAMKSSNPHSGIYEAKTSRTLDLNGGNPACNQGGVVVAIDCRNMAANNEVSATIQSKNQGGHSLNYINPIIYESEEDKC